MSGGAFNYNDYHITGIADQIEEFIRDNEDNQVYSEAMNPRAGNEILRMEGRVSFI